MIVVLFNNISPDCRYAGTVRDIATLGDAPKDPIPLKSIFNYSPLSDLNCKKNVYKEMLTKT